MYRCVSILPKSIKSKIDFGYRENKRKERRRLSLTTLGKEEARYDLVDTNCWFTSLWSPGLL